MSKHLDESSMTFWDHLEELRHVLFRIAVVVVALMLLAFVFKEELFDVVLAPKSSEFVTYQLFGKLADWLSMPGLRPDPFDAQLINTQLAGQFITHMTVSFYAGLILASPYVIYQLFRFVSPALYENEKKYSFRVVLSGYLLFVTGVLLNYFLIFPLTFRFLVLYQVDIMVENTIMLSSYIDTLTMLSLMMGIVFEIPILCWLFAKLGFLTPDFMVKYRKHALVLILIVSAIITPTSDVFTLSLVSVPMLLLYEASIGVVRHTRKVTAQVE